MTFEVLHSLQENVVDVGAVTKLKFGGIEIAKSVRGDIEPTIGSTVHILWNGTESCLDVVFPSVEGDSSRVMMDVGNSKAILRDKKIPFCEDRTEYGSSMG